mmetsp:Transcript_13250/g.44151  ORF Transcript_13250/g.44151 Transcript_13250/m.44151 type:complete len:201 (+) Transcript_13250:2-604(+)
MCVCVCVCVCVCPCVRGRGSSAVRGGAGRACHSKRDSAGLRRGWPTESARGRSRDLHGLHGGRGGRQCGRLAGAHRGDGHRGGGGQLLLLLLLLLLRGAGGPMSRLHVSRELAAVGGGVAALVALEGLLARVDTLVLSEGAGALEGGVALVALVWPNLGVCAPVVRQVPRLREHGAAELAGVPALALGRRRPPIHHHVRD